MNVRSLISNASVAFLAQGVSMVLSIVTSLLVPKVLGVEQYGYWQLFIFYTSYVGFFHLGLNDGMYLVHGGTTRDKIEKRPINSQFWFGMAYQTAFAALIVVVAFAGGFGPDRTFVIAWTAVFLLLNNSSLYLGYLFQAMNETKLFSYSTIIERAVFLVPLVALIAGRVTTFEPYVYAYAVSTTCKLVFCLWHARDFLTSGLEGLPVAARQAATSIRIGCKLMLANIASQLILGVARFVIDAVWGISTFGELSFSLSMVNFFLAFVTQASMVLFPALRQSEEGEVARFYRNARDIMGLFFPAVYVLYFPMVWLLSMWLPQYANSFIFFALLLPICVFDSKMNITCTTYFKVAREEALLLRVNVATTLVSAAFTLLGAYVMNSVFVVICGVVVAIVGRSLYSEHRITAELGVAKNLIWAGELAVTVVFVVLTAVAPTPVAIVGYLVAYVAFLWYFRDRAKELAVKVKRVGRG